MELLLYRRRRSRLLGQAAGKVLEVGSGTGMNLSHYPTLIDLTGIDVAHRMLARAERRAKGLAILIHLTPADVHPLPSSTTASTPQRPPSSSARSLARYAG